MAEEQLTPGSLGLAIAWEGKAWHRAAAAGTAVELGNQASATASWASAVAYNRAFAGRMAATASAASYRDPWPEA